MKKITSNVGIFLEAIMFVALGLVVLFFPTLTTNLLINFAGIVLLITGIISVVLFFRNKDNTTMQVLLGIEALMSVIFGGMLLFGNSITIALILVYILIFWFLVTAVYRLVLIIQLRKNSVYKIISIVLNVLVIIMSIWAFFNAEIAFNVFIWTIAFMFISTGIEKITSFYSY